ncbi:MAG TPA: PEP-CTERM sorting domain-containing protein [Sedimentisphaerales bacterium]|nr:PEP-CTERM sorting domain-containing protein [Sedimentisphaerales bacterium]
MKKLLVLLIVLAVASLGQAAIMDLQISSLNGDPIDPVKDITIGESDWVNLDIVYIPDGAGNLQSLDTVVSVDGLGTLDVSALTWAYNEGFNRTIEYTPGESYNISSGSFNGIGPGLIIDHILVHCDSGDPLNDVLVALAPDTASGGTIYLTGAPFDGTWGSVVIHQVPEPMTVALLGLGGLALLRRRK